MAAVLVFHSDRKETMNRWATEPLSLDEELRPSGLF